MIKYKNNRQRLAAEKIDDYQVGVFAFTDNGKLVLVTGRKSADWILPKGNTDKHCSDREQAREEAFEAAGLEGTMKWKYNEVDTSGKVKKLRVYPMKIKKLLKDFPERKERKRILISFDQAEKMVGKDLTEIIRCILSDFRNTFFNIAIQFPD